MEFGKSFTFVFEDQDWIMKILLAAVIAFIPIIGPLAVAGWGVEITKRALQKDPEQLPGWGDFINYLIKGLILLLIGFVYMLPVIIVQACSNGTFFFGQDSGEDAIQLIGTVVMVCFGCLSLLYVLLMGFVIPAAVGNYAATGEIGAAFRFGEVFDLVRAAPAAYLMVLIGAFLAAIIAFVGIIACIIGVFFTVAYAGAINAHLTGQAYYEAKMIVDGRGDELQQVRLNS